MEILAEYEILIKGLEGILRNTDDKQMYQILSQIKVIYNKNVPKAVKFSQLEEILDDAKSQ